MIRTLLLIAASGFAFQAQAKWYKLTRENCAMLLGHLRAEPLTIDRILAELRTKERALIRDCGPGCYEYEDWSAGSISPEQAENERKVASTYAESLVAKNEGLFLFSRYNGFDVPAWDGLTFVLGTGEITSKVSFKRGVQSRLALDQAFEKAHRFSHESASDAWAKLPLNHAKYPSRGVTPEEMLIKATENYSKMARWLLVEDERVRTRVVFQQHERVPMEEDLPAYAKRLMRNQPGREVESVTIINGTTFHHITF